MNAEKIKRFFLNHILECFVIALWILASLLTDKFLSTLNLLSILKNASMKGVLAVGMTVVIITGLIDLSVSSTVACTSVVFGMMFGAISGNEPMAFVLALLVMIGVSMIMASIHAVFIIKYDMPAMIVTMASMKLLFGVAGLLCNGYPITSFPMWYGKVGGASLAFGFPAAGIWFIAAVIIVSFILKRTKTGRNFFATGGNREAAHLSGINTVFTRWLALFIVQVSAVFAGIILSSQLRAGNHSYAQDWGLDIICSVIVGGTSFAGGRGSVYGTVIGMILVSTINNILTLLNVSTFYQYIAQGGLILLAVVLNTMRDAKLAKMKSE